MNKKLFCLIQNLISSSSAYERVKSKPTNSTRDIAETPARIEPWAAMDEKHREHIEYVGKLNRSRTAARIYIFDLIFKIQAGREMRFEFRLSFPHPVLRLRIDFFSFLLE